MFFVNSRYVLLTYAQCGDLDEWAVSNHMSDLGAECIIGREIHPDTGGFHFHVFVDFGRKFRSRSASVFDVEGRHPNVSPSRGTPEKGYDYAIKDGDVVAGGLGRPRPRGGMHIGADNVTNLAHLCENSEEFLELCDEVGRGDLIKNFNNKIAYARWRYKSVLPEYDAPPGVGGFCELDSGRAEWLEQSGIQSPDALLGKLFQWAERGKKSQGVAAMATRGDPQPPPSLVAKALIDLSVLLILLGRRKSLVLFGESRTGKTSWARSLGRHVFFSELFSGAMAEMITDDIKYAVFDDIRGGITFFHGWKAWLGCQAEFNNKALYRDPAPIKWGRPSIWCANKDPREEMCYYVMGERHFHKGYGQEDIDWLNANCIFVEITSPIFHASR